MIFIIIRCAIKYSSHLSGDKIPTKTASNKRSSINANKKYQYFHTLPELLSIGETSKVAFFSLPTKGSHQYLRKKNMKLQMWSPQHRRGEMWICWSTSRGRPQKWPKGWNTSPSRTGWELRLCSMGKRKLQEDLRAACQYLKEGCKKGGDRFFSRVCSNRTREWFQTERGEI